MQRFPFIAKLLLCATAASLIAACSSGSGSGSGATPPSKVTVSGVAAKGIVSNGIITIYSIERPTAIEPNGEGAAPNATDVAQPDYQGYWARAPINEATARTDDKGSYSLVLTNINGPVLVELTADEATQLVCDIKECADNDDVKHSFGDKYTAPSDFKLSAIYNIEATSKKIRLPLTPLTTIAEKNSQFQAEKYPGLAIAATIDMGNSYVQSVFNLEHTPTSVLPIDITTAAMPEPVALSGISLEQSIINAAFLEQLATPSSDLDTLLKDFSDESINKADLERFLVNVKTIAAEVGGNNTLLSTAANKFKDSYTIDICDVRVCVITTRFPNEIQSNLYKAKALVENTRNLILSIQAIQKDKNPDDAQLQVFNKSAKQLQEGAGPIGEALGNVVTFLAYYRETVLEGTLNPADLEENITLNLLAERVCNLFSEDAEKFIECSSAAKHFTPEDTTGMVTRIGNTWNLSTFSYDYARTELNKETASELCAIATGNSVSIELPDTIRLNTVEMDAGKIAASLKGYMRHLSCPKEGALAKRTELRIDNDKAAAITLDLRSKHNIETDENADLNSIEIHAEEVSLTSGDLKDITKPGELSSTISFTGGLHLKALRSQHFADLNGDNATSSLIPEIIKLNGTFVASPSNTFEASVNIHFKNAASYAFMNGEIRKDIATYQFVGEGASQQLLLNINPPEGGAYSYAYRISEIDQNCIDLPSCANISLARFENEDTASEALWIENTQISSYQALAIEDENCSLEEGCWVKVEMVVREQQTAEVESNEISTINPAFDLRQVFNPVQPSWPHNLQWRLLGSLENIIINDGEYSVYDDDYSEHMVNLSAAEESAKALPVFLQSPNVDLDKPNRYLLAETEVIVKGQKISSSLPLVDLKLIADRTGYRDGTLTLNLKWQEGKTKSTLNISVAAKDDEINAATMDDGNGTVFNLIYIGEKSVKGTIERDGTIYGTVKEERGFPMVFWLEGENTEFESLY